MLSGLAGFRRRLAVVIMGYPGWRYRAQGGSLALALMACLVPAGVARVLAQEGVAVPGAAAVLAVSSFSPVSGTIGTEVTIRGSGFTGVAGVRFGGVAGEFRVKSPAEITATVPAGASTGPVIITGHGGTAASREAFAIRPGIVLSALSGPPGTIVTVAGAGFAAGEAVDIYLGADFSVTDQALASATSGGAFAGVAAQVPAGAPNPGTVSLTAVGRHSGLSAQAQFSVRDTVRVISPGNQASVTGTAVRVPVSASDTGPGQALTFTADGLPPGLEVGNEPGATGVISGVPAEPGSFAVTVTARDSTGASGSAAFSWAVTNQVRVASPGNQVSATGTAASLQIQAADSQSGQGLAYAAEGLPPGLSASPATGLISGIPAELGDFAVTVTARDGTGASGSAAFSWAVTNPVTVNSPGNQFSHPFLEVSLQLQATGQAILSWTAEGLPPRLDIGTGPDGTGVISGIPVQAGNFLVTVIALGVNGLSGSAQFQWQVL